MAIWEWTLSKTPLLLLLLLSLASAQCYNANNTVKADVSYQKCGNGPGADDFSMCCAIQNRDLGSNDICGKNGLCGNKFIGNSSFWRESCTDPSWKSKSCLKLCITGLDPSGIPMNSKDREILQCPNGSFCCKDLNSTCCEDGDGLWIDNSTYTLLNYDPTLATSQSLSNTSSTTSTTTTPVLPPVTPQPSSSNTAAIAGGTVGGVAGLAAMLGLALFWRRRRSHKTSSGGKYHDEGNSWERVEKEGNGLVEMDANDRASRTMEMEGSDRRAENVELEGVTSHIELDSGSLTSKAYQKASLDESDKEDT